MRLDTAVIEYSCLLCNPHLQELYASAAAPKGVQVVLK
jgi:hypothetical protein